MDYVVNRQLVILGSTCHLYLTMYHHCPQLDIRTEELRMLLFVGILLYLYVRS